MSKQTFKIGKSFIPNILVLSCSAILLLFGTLLAVSPVASHTNALVQTGEDGLSLVTNQTLDATIKPAENGSLYVVKDTIVGSINSQFGYEIYVSVNSSSVNDIYLNGDTTNTGSNQKINATTGTYNTPAALDLTNGATWGYAIAGLGSFDATYNETNPASSAKFAAMPVIENKQLIHESSSAIADDETEIYYGIKADTSLEPGLYTTEILYTAIPKPAPMVAKAILGDNHNLNFIYDNLTYTVGDTYTDNKGTTEITHIFTAPVASDSNSDIPWLSDYTVYPTITSINFESSFHDFKPTSTASWFNDMRYITSITNIENLNTSESQRTDYMFNYVGSEVETLDMGNVKNLDFRKVLTAHGMFYGVGYNVTNLTLNLDGLNFAVVTDMGDIFDNFGYSADNINLSLKNWNVPKLQNLRMAFWDVGQYSESGSINIDVSGWTLGSLTDCTDMFYHAAYYASEFNLIGMSSWDMSTVLTTHYMFENAAWYVTDFDLDVHGWNLSSAQDLYGMFYGIGYYSTTWHMDASGWTFGNDISDSRQMFYYAGYGDYGVSTTWSIDVSDWTFGTNMSLEQVFASTGANATTSWAMTGTSTWHNTINVVSLESAFNYAGRNATSWTIDSLASWNVSNVTNMNAMFISAGYNATSWSLGNLSSWNTGNVTVMANMFCLAGYNAGANFYIGDISNWNVNNVTSHYDFIVEDSNNPHGIVEPNWIP